MVTQKHKKIYKIHLKPKVALGKPENGLQEKQSLELFRNHHK